MSECNTKHKKELFPGIKIGAEKNLQQAREAYFEAGGIESDIGPRSDPSWYWRRTILLLKDKIEILKAFLKELNEY